jgi:hypothetical protein
MIELNHKLNSLAPSPIQGHAQMVIIKPEGQFSVAFPDEVVIGEVNAQLDKALTSIAEQGYELDFEVFAPITAIQETIGRATGKKEAVVRVQVNVYGPPTAAGDIGRELSQQKLYLQRPSHVRDGYTYENPHMLKLPGFHCSTSEPAMSAEDAIPEKPSLQVLKSTIQDVYSSLTRGNNLRGLEGDQRLSTRLLLYVFSLLL